MPQFIQGTVGAGSFGVDDIYLAVLSPLAQIGPLGRAYNGAAVGPASWGPLNSPQTGNTPGDLLNIWGPTIAGGLVQEGSLFLAQRPQGGFIGVRVGDGTQVKATIVLQDGATPTPATGVTATALYEGDYGNQIQVLLTQGSNYQATAKTYKVIVQAGSHQAEIFDRIPTGATGGPWANIVAAVNNGQNALRPASAWVRLTVGTSTAEPTFPASGSIVVTLAGGTNGTGTLATTNQLGVDGASGSRTGMYALRGSTFDAIWLCGNVDSTAYSAVQAFAKSCLAAAYHNIPTGDSISAAITAKLTAGIDDAWSIVCKDFITYSDSVLNQIVSVPPAPVIAGMACRNRAAESPSNTPAFAIIGTEQSVGTSAQPYSNADLAQLEAAGILVVTNPIPSGRKFGLHYGKNSSSQFATSEITYTRLTNELMRDLGGPTMGQFVGKIQTTATNDPLRLKVYHALSDYLSTKQSLGDIAQFTVVCDTSNNPAAQVRQGILRADVTVVYGAVVDKFLINLTAGQTVSVQSTNQLAA